MCAPCSEAGRLFPKSNVFELKIVSKVSVKVFEVQLWLNYVSVCSFYKGKEGAFHKQKL